MPLPFTQAFGVGTLVAAWVTIVQQAWHSLHITYALGEAMTGNMTILEAADRYDALRKTLGVKSLPSAAYYRRSAETCTIAQYQNQRSPWDGLSFCGW